MFQTFLFNEPVKNFRYRHRQEVQILLVVFRKIAKTYLMVIFLRKCLLNIYSASLLQVCDLHFIFPDNVMPPMCALQKFKTDYFLEIYCCSCNVFSKSIISKSYYVTRTTHHTPHTTHRSPHNKWPL